MIYFIFGVPRQLAGQALTPIFCKRQAQGFLFDPSRSFSLEYWLKAQ
jgi:hypothetical protein